MYDYGWRQYMPDVARWMQLDPLVEDTEDPYAYVYNNPISLTDPDGRAPDDVLETDCCPDKSSSSLPSDPMEFSSMIAGGWNSVRASVSNLFARGYNEVADKRIDRKYVVDEIGQLVLIGGVPAETRREKIENTIGDLATIALSAAGGVQGNLLTQGGKAPVLKGVQEIKNEVQKVTAKRGSFRKGTVKESWDNAKNGSQPNTKQCPTCKKDVKGNPYNKEKRTGPDGWDMSHNPSWTKRDHTGMTRKQQLDDYNKGAPLECASCNRSGGNNDSRFHR